MSRPVMNSPDMNNPVMGRYAQAGFTLLELLIALVLTGLLTVVVYGGLQIGISSWEKVIDRNEEVSDAFLTQRFLRRLLKSARPEPVVDIYNNASTVAFLGLESELLLLAPLPRFEGQGELLWIYLNIDSDSQALPQLKMATAPFDTNEPIDWDILLTQFRSGEEVTSHVLEMGALQQIELQYLEVAEGEFDSWEPEWRFKTTLPTAIQMSFEMVNPDSSVWPDLVVILQEYAYEIKYAP